MQPESDFERRVIADLHIHSRFSRATSMRMNIDEITRFAETKGLTVVGTGDFTHPKWHRELKDNLVCDPEEELYKPASKPGSSLRYMISGEVCTIFNIGNTAKKIHHLILSPSLETADQINDRLARYGDLMSDGRPVLDMTAPQLVEEIMEVSTRNFLIPAHVWTPWFSLFGALSGFDRIEDCYQDMTKHIKALETGLSSDPPMNWRLSALDKYTLVSNSDCHSPWPWRIGREANVFELDKLTYHEIVDALSKKDLSRIKFTIETDPAYGKYHWTGHRRCQISLPPKRAIELRNRCPVCRRQLTKGVEQRVEELADRPMDYRSGHFPGYVRLLPLSEIISTILRVTYPGASSVWTIYNTLVSKFGDEYTVLMHAPLEEMKECVEAEIAEAIVRVREGRVKVIPGYDGVYGQIVFFDDDSFSEEGETEEASNRIGQRNLSDYV